MRQPALQSVSTSMAVSDVLSLGSSDDPMVDLVSARTTTVPMAIPNSQGQEVR
jgi:hypothetical protein